MITTTATVKSSITITDCASFRRKKTRPGRVSTTEHRCA
jgi:hypothetical protein